MRLFEEECATIRRDVFVSILLIYWIYLTYLIYLEYEYEHISSNSRTLFFEYKHTFLRIDAHLGTFFFNWWVSERAYLDQDKQRCLSSSHLEKNFSSRKKSFFSTFQLDETKTIESIFAFSIICFSVYTKSISMLLVFDLVVFVLVIALVLVLVFVLVLLHQLQIWDFLLFRQQ